MMRRHADEGDSYGEHVAPAEERRIAARWCLQMAAQLETSTADTDFARDLATLGASWRYEHFDPADLPDGWCTLVDCYKVEHGEAQPSADGSMSAAGPLAEQRRGSLRLAGDPSLTLDQPIIAKGWLSPRPAPARRVLAAGTARP